jgi:hypothetical protein
VRPEKIEPLVDQVVRERRDPPDMMFLGTRKVAVGSGPVPRGGAEVWLIRYDPRPVEVTPKRGDTRGQTLIQRNVVHQIERLGAWRGRPTAFKMPAAETDGLETVVLVQGAKGGKIIAVLAK